MIQLIQNYYYYLYLTEIEIFVHHNNHMENHNRAIGKKKIMNRFSFSTICDGRLSNSTHVS
jgi:hypothetical protein